MFKKSLCVILASLLLAGSLVACGESSEPAENPNSPQTQDVSNAEIDTRETLDIPEDRYDGTELCFLTRDEGSWSTVEVFTDSKTANSDNISYAVFERNDHILQNYGVKVIELKNSEQISKTSREVSAPTGDFQVVVTNVRDSATLAAGGYLWNLKSDMMEAIDLTKPWWDRKMAEGLSVDGRLYYATGDIMTLDNDATFAIMFNKTIAEECQIPNLYEMVDNGEWTMNHFYSMSTQAVQDLDGNGSLTSMEDIVGFAYTADAPNCMFVAGGVTLCQKDEDDLPYFALDVERGQNVAEKGSLVFARDHSINMSNLGGGIEEVGKKYFGEGRALFFGECLQCVTRVRGYDVDFGIIPFPKYNQEQDSYYSLMHYIASMVSIPKSVKERDLLMVESMLEAMAYYSVDTLTKQYYEINLKTKGAKDVESGPMIDTILASRACDLSYYHDWGSGAFENIAKCMVYSTNISIASMGQKVRRGVETSISRYLSKIGNYD